MGGVGGLHLVTNMFERCFLLSGFTPAFLLFATSFLYACHFRNIFCCNDCIIHVLSWPTGPIGTWMMPSPLPEHSGTSAASSSWMHLVRIERGGSNLMVRRAEATLQQVAAASARLPFLGPPSGAKLGRAPPPPCLHLARFKIKDEICICIFFLF